MLRAYYDGMEVPLDGTLLLNREESHHLLRVRRVRPGQEIEILDGQGTIYLSRCPGVGDKARELRLPVENIIHAPRPSPPIELYAALLKGRHFEETLRHAAEIGVHRVQPLLTDNVEKQPPAERWTHTLERWRTLAIESLKQCGNPWLPEIFPPQGFQQTLAPLPDAGGTPALSLVAALLPDAQSFTELQSQIQSAPGIRLLIGPEGDFSPREYAALTEAGWIGLQLGSNILRAPTAAAVALALLRCTSAPAPRFFDLAKPLPGA